MAISTTSQVVFDGNRRTTMQFTGISDGSGNLNLATLVDCKALNPKCQAVKVQAITGFVSYGIVELFWEALPPVKFAELGVEAIEIDYSQEGNLTNKVAGPDATGNILISTQGFAAGSHYSLLIDLIKRYTDKVQVV